MHLVSPNPRVRTLTRALTCTRAHTLPIVCLVCRGVGVYAVAVAGEVGEQPPVYQRSRRSDIISCIHVCDAVAVSDADYDLERPPEP